MQFCCRAGIRSAARLALLVQIGVAPFLLPASPAAGAGNELKLVVGFAAGSGVDAIARVMAERVRTSSGHPVIVENRPGAGNETSASRRGPQPESIFGNEPNLRDLS